MKLAISATFILNFGQVLPSNATDSVQNRIMTETQHSSHAKFNVAIDCIILAFQRGTLKILLQEHDLGHRKKAWGLLGGFVEERESPDDAARRILTELTGLPNVFMQQVNAFGSVQQDDEEPVVSIAYYALLNLDRYVPERNSSNRACWEDINHLPPLLSNHGEMVNQALCILRNRITVDPLGFNLLPQLFTLSLLQSLHETVLGEPIDKRNFRKRINEMHFIEKTAFIDKTGSKRGAFLYRFNNNAYHKESVFRL